MIPYGKQWFTKMIQSNITYVSMFFAMYSLLSAKAHQNSQNKFYSMHNKLTSCMVKSENRTTAFSSTLMISPVSPSYLPAITFTWSPTLKCFRNSWAGNSNASWKRKIRLFNIQVNTFNNACRKYYKTWKHRSIACPGLNNNSSFLSHHLK